MRKEKIIKQRQHKKNRDKTNLKNNIYKNKKPGNQILKNQNQKKKLSNEM